MHCSYRNREPLYRLAFDLSVEHFHEESIILLASKDKLISVNKSGAALLELLMNTFISEDFSSGDLAALISRNYFLSEPEAATRADTTLSDWVRLGIFIPGNDQLATGDSE
jgi:hypothetical protein